MLHRMAAGFHSCSQWAGLSAAFYAASQDAAGIREVAQSVLESRCVMRKTPRGPLRCRDARRRTRTAKLVNSKSCIGTNNRFELPLESVKNFIIVFNSLSFSSTYVAGDATSITLALDSAFSLSD